MLRDGRVNPPKLSDLVGSSADIRSAALLTVPLIVLADSRRTLETLETCFGLEAGPSLTISSRGSPRLIGRYRSEPVGHSSRFRRHPGQLLALHDIKTATFLNNQPLDVTGVCDGCDS
jgi:hypothetical protein